MAAVEVFVQLGGSGVVVGSSMNQCVVRALVWAWVGARPLVGLGWVGAAAARGVAQVRNRTKPLSYVDVAAHARYSVATSFPGTNY